MFMICLALQVSRSGEFVRERHQTFLLARSPLPPITSDLFLKGNVFGRIDRIRGASIPMFLWNTTIVDVITPGRRDRSWTGRFPLRYLTRRRERRIIYLYELAVHRPRNHVSEEFLDIPAHIQTHCCISALLPVRPNARFPTATGRC